MGEAIFLRHRSDPLTTLLQILVNRCQLTIDVFIQSLLLLHVEAWQPVIDHQHHIDIARPDAAFLAQLLRQFCRAAVAVAVGENPIEIICLKITLSQKTPYHFWHLVTVDWRDNTDCRVAEITFFLVHHLGNTQRRVVQLSRNIETVASAREIKKHLPSPF